MILLFINEFINFYTLKLSSQMYVDKNRGSDRIKVNIDIDIYNTPCDLLTIVTDNVFGDKTIELIGDINKSRLDKFGKIFQQKKYEVIAPEYDEIKNEILNGEGCNLKGYFFLNAIPGHFQITSGYHAFIIQDLAEDKVLKNNNKHKINQISFGDINLENIRKKFGKEIETLTHTLTNIQREVKNAKVHHYFLKIVPTKFITYSGEKIDNYQYTYSSYPKYNLDEISSIDFRYDISSITLEYKQYKERFINFFVHICAIIGGVFTIMGIIESIIHKSVLVLLRKAQMNKLA